MRVDFCRDICNEIERERDRWTAERHVWCKHVSHGAFRERFEGILIRNNVPLQITTETVSSQPHEGSRWFCPVKTISTSLCPITQKAAEMQAGNRRSCLFAAMSASGRWDIFPPPSPWMRDLLIRRSLHRSSVMWYLPLQLSLDAYHRKTTPSMKHPKQSSFAIPRSYAIEVDGTPLAAFNASKSPPARVSGGRNAVATRIDYFLPPRWG